MRTSQVHSRFIPPLAFRLFELSADEPCLSGNDDADGNGRGFLAVPKRGRVRGGSGMYRRAPTAADEARHQSYDTNDDHTTTTARWTQADTDDARGDGGGPGPPGEGRGRRGEADRLEKVSNCRRARHQREFSPANDLPQRLGDREGRGGIEEGVQKTVINAIDHANDGHRFHLHLCFIPYRPYRMVFGARREAFLRLFYQDPS